VTGCCGSADDARQRCDRKPSSDLTPRLELLPTPAVHPDLAALAALSVLCRDACYAESVMKSWVGLWGVAVGTFGINGVTLTVESDVVVAAVITPTKIAVDVVRRGWLGAQAAGPV
jgi:hypothetical protein